MDKELPGLPDSNRRHSWVIVLFLFYAALSIVAWTLTCILSNRPLNFSSYYSQAGNFTPEQYQVNDRWREATVVLRTLSATITLPITTTIASQAAVVYIQQKEGLSLRQTLAIADRGWTDIGTFLACVNPAMARLIWTPFLLFALFLTLIGVIAYLYSVVYLYLYVTRSHYPAATIAFHPNREHASCDLPRSLESRILLLGPSIRQLQ